MGVAVNISGSFDGVDRAQIRDYIESVVTEATGEPPQRVIYHTAAGQSPRERTRQLMALKGAK